MKRVLLILAMLIITAPYAYGANTWYVSKTGSSGGDGSSGNPKLTILQGAALMAPGDTLIVRPGTYQERLYNSFPSGTSWATRTIFKAETKHTVTILPTAGGSDIFNIWFHSGRQYIEVDGFILEGNGPVRSQQSVLINETAHHIRIKNCIIRNTLSNGIFISAGAFPGTSRSCCNEFINLEVTNTATSATLGQAGGGHGIYMSTSDNLIEHSHFHNNAGYGIHVYSSFGGVNRNTVRYNRVNNNNTKKNPAGVVVGSGGPHFVYNNLIYHNAGGLTLTASGSSVYNNTIVNNVFSPGSDSDIGIIANGGATFRNNIVYGHTTNVGGPGAASITAQANNLIGVNPQFFNLAGEDFRLTAASTAAINKGVATTLVPDDYIGVSRPQGGVYDIGAYEFDDGDPPLETVPVSHTALETTHTCATGTNALNASVKGSLFYLENGVPSSTVELVRSKCASSIQMTDVASFVGTGHSLITPFAFLGTPGPNVSNTCTNCLAVHNGTVVKNEANSGWSVPALKQGSSIATATGGPHIMLALSQLCKKVINGVSTNDPLWPWPMEDRIKDARLAAGEPSVEVTTKMETIFGTIPAECKVAVEEPPVLVATSLVMLTQPVTNKVCPDPSAPVQVIVHDQFGAPLSISDISIDLAIGDNPSLGILDGIPTAETVNGVATFSSWCISTAGVGYSLMATSPGLTGVESSSFTITQDPEADNLVFVLGVDEVPLYSVITPPIEVQVKNEQGLLVTDSTAEVTLSLDEPVDGEELVGTLVRNATAGVAIFNDIRIAGKPREGYTVRATSSGLSSGVFTIRGVEREATDQAAGSFRTTPLFIMDKNR